MRRLTSIALSAIYAAAVLAAIATACGGAFLAVVG